MTKLGFHFSKVFKKISHEITHKEKPTKTKLGLHLSKGLKKIGHDITHKGKSKKGVGLGKGIHHAVKKLF